MDGGCKSPPSSYQESYMNKKIVRDLELVVEIQELRELGIDEEEIAGFFGIYYESWELNENGTFNN
jgi:hypothetical protein